VRVDTRNMAYTDNVKPVILYATSPFVSLTRVEEVFLSQLELTERGLEVGVDHGGRQRAVAQPLMNTLVLPQSAVNVNCRQIVVSVCIPSTCSTKSGSSALI
jgi:hypothetical protein